jgi:hypothetical protein
VLHPGAAILDVNKRLTLTKNLSADDRDQPDDQTKLLATSF